MKNTDLLVKINGIIIIDNTNSHIINSYVDLYLFNGNYIELYIKLDYIFKIEFTINLNKIIKKMSKSQIKNALLCYTLLNLADTNQPEMINIGKNKDKQWATFETFNSKKIKDTISPLSISNEVLYAMGLIFNMITTLINNNGKLHHESPISKLINAECEINIIDILFKVTEKATLIKRNFNFIQLFNTELEKKVSSELVDPGASEVTSLFLNFIKLISWKCSHRIFSSQKKLTLNFSLFKNMILDMIIIGNLEKIPALLHDLNENKMILISKEVISKEVITKRLIPKESITKKSTNMNNSNDENSNDENSNDENSNDENDNDENDNEEDNNDEDEDEE